ncbi:DEAD/DEAH box helicase [Maioricimonas sp. JC845]|uniref:DEAD/DEAH box helicase n=1 Tax=Maioricimonas sp. JC845 TaxID=3232138 RepID=UPI00345782EC
MAAGTSTRQGQAAGTRRTQLTFRDRISRLTHHQACRLLGDDGEQLLAGNHDCQIDPDEDVYVGSDLFRVRLTGADGDAVVILKQASGRKKDLQIDCDACEGPCEHAAAALRFLLDEKLTLGLSAPPDEAVPLELLTEEELHQRALAERQERAASEKMTLRACDPHSPWGDYVLTSHNSGRSYRVAIHGEEPGTCYCSCPDYRTNHLGTCKHILHALEKIRKRFPKKALQEPFRRTCVEAWMDYSAEGGVRFNLPDDAGATLTKLVRDGAAEPLHDAREVVRLVSRMERSGHEVLVYPDVEEWIDRNLTQQQLREATEELRRDPASHPLRTELLNAELLPYQLDGIAFAVGAGRAILADDMGLGKTIQGIGVAELFAQLAGVERVLVVCPASLKSQWRDEIERFSGRSVQVVLGRADERSEQYAAGAFFTICNYEQVLRDLPDVEKVDWDLIILDEAQRIKNWESKTSQVIRALQSRFALVLTGTPMENRLDELFTVVKFVDDRLLGPAYRFFHKHRIVDDNGRVQGYRHLDELRQQLKSILLRRTRGEVVRQLPERTTTLVKIKPTQEQAALHATHMHTVAQIVGKRFLTEMDLLRLQKALVMCRMAADSTYLVEKEEPGFSSKLDRLEELLTDLAEQENRKIVLFSEWRRMLDQIESVLERVGMDYVRLDGSVPQKKRPDLVHRFQNDPDCQVILMTNAGSTGLNLQAANTVINVDLPWNPAVLEQRIARAHRMGQENPVHVYLLVTEDTIEENLLSTLAAKQELATAALDMESDLNEVQIRGGMEELRRRVERLIGETPKTQVDAASAEAAVQEAEAVRQRRERVASAGGQLLGAAVQLVGELVSQKGQVEPDPDLVQQVRKGLSESVERDEVGRPQLRFTWPDDDALEEFATSLAKLMVTKA